MPENKKSLFKVFIQKKAHFLKNTIAFPRNVSYTYKNSFSNIPKNSCFYEVNKGIITSSKNQPEKEKNEQKVFQ